MGNLVQNFHRAIDRRDKTAGETAGEMSMQRVLAVLMSSVSLVSVAAHAQSTPGDVPAWAAEATMNPDYKPGDVAPGYPTEQPAAEAPAAEPSSTVAPAESTPAAADTASEALPPQTEPGVTSFYGDTKLSETPAWAAEATMNPDYTPGAAAPPADTAAEPAAEPEQATAASEPETLPPQTGPGVTSFYGDSAPAATAAWAAEAKMNPDYTPGAKAPAASESATSDNQQAIETCRDALNGEVKSAAINFASSKWDVLPASYKVLDKLAQIAKDCGNVVIEVGGYTDNVGKTDANVTISKLRAESVVRYLTDAGVDAARLKATGYGDAKPIGDNETAAGRQQNRRIEFLVSGKG